MKTVEILQQLIQIPSVSGHEQKIQDWIFQFISTLGLEPEWVGPNVVVKIPGKDNTKALIFNGHVDTVSPGEEKAWTYPPFMGKIGDGKMYGLGSTDMKSGVAVMLKLVERYSLIQPIEDLWFHFVVQEETSGEGTKEVMEWFSATQQKHYKSLAGILADGAYGKIKVAHKGNIFLKVTVKGDGGHGSTPEKIKLHAIIKMYKVAKNLIALVNSWQAKYSDGILGRPTIVWTSMQAGDMGSPNKIGDTSVAIFDIRTTPLVHDKALDLIYREIASKNVDVKPLFSPLSYGFTSPEADIVKLAQKATGLPVGKTPGSTDLLFFTAHNIPAIILGVGNMETEHNLNEYVEIKNMKICLKFFQAIIENF